MQPGRIVRFPWEARTVEARALGRAERVCRVDRYVVAPRERDRVLAEIRESHEILRTVPGFSRHLVMERRARRGALDIVTVVEWGRRAAFTSAEPTVPSRDPGGGPAARGSSAAMRREHGEGVRGPFRAGHGGRAPRSGSGAARDGDSHGGPGHGACSRFF